MKNFLKRTGYTLLVSVMLMATLSVSGPSRSINAESIGELQQKSSDLQAEIEANEAKARDFGHRAATLQGRIDQLNEEIISANNKIELLSVKINELELRLVETEAELERQKGLLKASMRALYKRSGASTVELLAASESFSEFIDEQEYLERLKLSIQESTEKVLELKVQIQQEKSEQESLKEQQEQQRNVLGAKRTEQNRLLEQTKGEEAKYLSMVANQQKELEEAEERLSALLSSGIFTPLGPVSRGQAIGSIGSTGYSTGPHLHFMVKNKGTSINPHAGGESIINGYSWPVPNYEYISTAFGDVHCSDYTGCNPPGSSYYIYHSGLDIAADYYTPVVAAADGEVVYKGCQSGLGYVIVIDHGGGWQTWYPHMVTPDGQVTGYCS